MQNNIDFKKLTKVLKNQVFSNNNTRSHPKKQKKLSLEAIINDMLSWSMFIRKHIHFVGIGGIGMSAIAQVLFQKGFKVSGSDISQNQITKKIKKK